MVIATLLTDFGTADYYVGAVKGTILRLLDDGVPDIQLVDLTHDLPAGDIAGAADLLAAAAPTFPRGTLHLAIVDPGVGSDRRILATRSGGHLFVAPDNGLLTPFVPPLTRDGATARAGTDVRQVIRAELFLPAPGATFHGRDRFAPIAAALLRGEPLEELGPRIDDPVRLESPPPSRERTAAGILLHGRVTRVDRFGNLVTDLPAAWLEEGEAPSGPDRASGPAPPAGASGARVRVGDHSTGVWVDHYAELAPAEPGALVGSLGTIELSLRNRSLAEYWGVGRGVPVRIELGP